MTEAAKIENEAGRGPFLAPGARPTVNRWVHYTSAGSADSRFPSVCRAALVTEVPGPESEAAARGVVGLCVFYPTRLHFRPIADGGAAYDPGKNPTTWHWPERG